MTGSPAVMEGQHALVVGASRSLGRAAALVLAEAGACVSLTTVRVDDRGEEARVHSVLNECWTLGRDGRVLTLELEGAHFDAPAFDELVAELEREFGPLTVLVSIEPGRAASRPAARASLSVAQAVGRRMRTRGAGRIVFVVSLGPEADAADELLHDDLLCADAVPVIFEAQTRLAAELRGDGVSVNTLVVGPASEEARGALPLRRLEQAADLPSAIEFLVSDAADETSGQLLLVEGERKVGSS